LKWIASQLFAIRPTQFGGCRIGWKGVIHSWREIEKETKRVAHFTTLNKRDFPQRRLSARVIAPDQPLSPTRPEEM